jgi:hypothetical protein
MKLHVASFYTYKNVLNEKRSKDYKAIILKLKLSKYLHMEI